MPPGVVGLATRVFEGVFLVMTDSSPVMTSSSPVMTDSSPAMTLISVFPTATVRMCTALGIYKLFTAEVYYPIKKTV